jgi:D-cysteine desulfhydrase/L-cysteate sulfo-lyase
MPTRVPLIHAPTPLHRLDRVSADLGIDLWIKRDDLTGFAGGGNKGRKLEYLMADALAEGAEVVVTCGAAQSNFIRQLGAACARFGIRCAAAVMALPFEFERPTGEQLDSRNGNVLLDALLDVYLRTFPDSTWEELYGRAEELAMELEAQGQRVYRIPIGGSSPLGAYAFTQAAQEISGQGPEFDEIVFASSSGSTHTGLAHAYRGRKTRVFGVACDPEPEIAEDFAELGYKLDSLLGTSVKLKPEEFDLDFGFVGPAYGVPSQEGMAALKYLAKAEGVFLDPIYSGKAFASLLHRAREGSLSGRVLFWHTGGVPTLFALPESMLGDSFTVGEP